jgi:hypothetical protein
LESYDVANATARLLLQKAHFDKRRNPALKLISVIRWINRAALLAFSLHFQSALCERTASTR